MSAHTNIDQDQWMAEAKCRGINPAEFFPSDGTGVDKARRLCEQCTVKAECLEYALEHRIEHGVWGGTSERERRRIQRTRRNLLSLTPVPTPLSVATNSVVAEPVATGV